MLCEGFTRSDCPSEKTKGEMTKCTSASGLNTSCSGRPSSTAAEDHQMNKLERVSGGSRAIVKFNPKQTRMKLGALKEGVKLAAKIKDWGSPRSRD